MKEIFLKDILNKLGKEEITSEEYLIKVYNRDNILLIEKLILNLDRIILFCSDNTKYAFNRFFVKDQDLFLSDSSVIDAYGDVEIYIKLTIEKLTKTKIEF